jgi:hypothetical protein
VCTQEWHFLCNEQIPSWEGDSRSGSHDFPFLLENLKHHYHIHKSLLLDLILSQLNPVHLQVVSSLQVSRLNSVWISYMSHACYMFHTSHPPRRYHPNIICWQVQIIELVILKFSPITSFLLSFSQTPSICVIALGWEITLYTLQKQVKFLTKL